ncbi:MAG: hypothetical protein HY712_05915 [candidate division NC10 bacterium]|nr:hypothetical protein [candidate division NC10 bacterium]
MGPAASNSPAPQTAASKAALDVKLASDLLIQLNIIRKNARIYPDSHPALRASVGRAARLLQAFFKENEAFSLTVARNTVQIGKHRLSPGNPVVAEFAAHLRDRSIHSMSLKRGIQEEGLARIGRLLSRDPKTLASEIPLGEAVAQASGGYAEVRLLDWNASEFAEVLEIDLSDRSASPGSSESSWNAFVRRLLQRGDEALLGGEQGLALSDVGGEKLAALADRLEAAQDRLADRQALADYVREGASGEEDTPHNRLLRLANTLESRLRNELIRTARQFAARSLKGAETLLNEKDVQLVLRVFEQVNAKGLPVTTKVVALVEALAGKAGEAARWRAIVERPSQEREFCEHVQALLSAQGFPAPPATEDPAQALRKLEEDLRLRTGSASTGSALLATLPKLSELEHYVTTLQDLLAGAASLAVAEAHARTLASLIAGQAQAGNWGIVLIVWRGLSEIEARTAPDNPALSDLCRKAKTQSWSPEEHPRLATAILSYGLDKAEFLSDILRVSGRTQGQQIVEAFAVEGRAAAQPALLALIVELREQTMPHVLRLLDDKRSAVVCRMLQLLQKFGDPTPLRKIEGLVGRPAVDVKLETLRTLAVLKSPKAPLLLRRAIGSPDERLSVGAIAIAQLIPSPEVSRALLEILRAPRWFKRTFDTDRKVEAARSLIAMQKAELLSEVYRCIARRPIFHAREFRRLRVEAFRTLINADASELGDLLRLGRRLGEPEITGICKELERRVRTRTTPAPQDGRGRTSA